MSMYYTYVLKSSIDDNLYVGCTDNLKKRIEEHNKGLVVATKYRRPLTIVYYEACCDKVKAFRREGYFKSGYGRRFLKSRI